MVSEHGASEKCKSCRFRKPLHPTSGGPETFCDHIGIMKRRRGCPGGDECTKWEPKPRAIAKHLLRLPPEKTIFAKFYKER